MIPSSQTTNGEAERQASGRLPGWLRRSLQSRITALVLVVTVPLLVGMIVFLTVQARRELVNAANQTLSAANNSVSETTRLWLEYNTNALKTLLNSPDITTMNNLWQGPMLKEMAASYPYMYLVSTVDVNGINQTRSDDQPPINYKDRYLVPEGVERRAGNVRDADRKNQQPAQPWWSLCRSANAAARPAAPPARRRRGKLSASACSLSS